MNETNERSVASDGSVTAGIRKCIAAHDQIPWGWDGDCGSDDIISRIAEECDKIDAARTAPTLTDEEREAVEAAIKSLLDDPYDGATISPHAATLRGLLDRLK